MNVLGLVVVVSARGHVEIAAALKHRIRNPETESRKGKRNTESVKEGSKRSI